MLLSEKNENIVYYLIDGEEFRVTFLNEYVVIERKVGEWIHDFPSRCKDVVYEYVCMIRKDHICILKKLFEELCR